jgi:hypothetical protein
VKSRSLSGAREARRSSCSGASKPRTGEGDEVGPLGLDEPPEEPCGVEVGAERAADLRRHVPAARGGAVAEVHVGHLTMPASERASKQCQRTRRGESGATGEQTSYRPGGS